MIESKVIDYDDNLVFGIIRNNILNGNLEYTKANIYVIDSDIDSKTDITTDINTDLYLIKVDVSGFDGNLIEEAINKMLKSYVIESKDFSYYPSISSAWCKEEEWLEISISHFLFSNIFEYNL